MELGIFVDESGDFDMLSEHSPYYIFTLVLHDKKNDIRKEIDTLERHLSEKGFKDFPIHSAPLIRKESIFRNNTINERKTLLLQMDHFTKTVPVQLKSFVYSKKDFEDYDKLITQMARDLAQFVFERYAWLNSFTKIKVYYDYGQGEISMILNVGLNTLLKNVEFKKVTPSDYKLLQVADFVCTIKLLEIKLNNNELSKSEKSFMSLKDWKNMIKRVNSKEIK